MKTINQTYIILQQVRKLYHANNLIYKSLPRLKKKATSADLRKSYEIEIEERLRQQHRIEIIFNILKESTEGNMDDVISAMSHSQKKLAEKSIKNGHTDKMMIITSHAMSTSLAEGYESTINSAVGIINPDITRLLRRALREERAIEKRLSLLEEIHINSRTKKEALQVCDLYY